MEKPRQDSQPTSVTRRTVFRNAFAAGLGTGVAIAGVPALAEAALLYRDHQASQLLPKPYADPNLPPDPIAENILLKQELVLVRIPDANVLAAMQMLQKPYMPEEGTPLYGLRQDFLYRAESAKEPLPDRLATYQSFVKDGYTIATNEGVQLTDDTKRMIQLHAYLVTRVYPINDDLPDDPLQLALEGLDGFIDILGQSAWAYGLIGISRSKYTNTPVQQAGMALAMNTAVLAACFNARISTNVNATFTPQIALDLLDALLTLPLPQKLR